jgi:hypothetical protein
MKNLSHACRKKIQEINLLLGLYPSQSILLFFSSEKTF